MQLVIITPHGILGRHEIEKIFLPGTLGAFEVLRGHAPIISSLEVGRVRYAGKDGDGDLMISGGFVRVADDVIELCVELSKEVQE